MNKYLKYILCCTSFALAITDQVAIVINDHVVTESELLETIDGYAKLSSGANYKQDPNFKGYVSQMLVTYQLLSDFAESNHIGLTEEEKQQALEGFVEMKGKTVAEFGEIASEIGVSSQWLRNFVFQNVLQQKIGAMVVAPSVSVEDEEVQRVVDLWVGDNTEYRIKSWTIDKRDSQASIAASKEIKAKWAQTGENPQSGEVTDMGWVKRSALPQLFLNALSGVEPGNLVGPVTSDYGYHLIWFEGEKRPDEPDFEAVKRSVFQDKFMQDYNEWLTELVSYNSVIYK